MKNFLLSLCLLIATPLRADDVVQCNDHGAVLTFSEDKVYYLGKNCDAIRKGGGTGGWFLAASFLAIVIDGKSVEQIRFDIDCPVLYSGPHCSNDILLAPE